MRIDSREVCFQKFNSHKGSEMDREIQTLRDYHQKKQAERLRRKRRAVESCMVLGHEFVLASVIGGTRRCSRCGAISIRRDTR